MPASSHPRFIARILALLLAPSFAVAADAGSVAVPIITFISPVSAVAGGAAFTLTVNGAGFVAGANPSVVQWNGTALATTFVSEDQLTAEVPAALIAGQGTGWVTVANRGCSGACSLASNTIYFPVGTPSVALSFGAYTAATVASPPSEMAQGDFNGDGKLDLAVSNSTGNTVSIFLGNGDGTFQPPTFFNTTTNPWGIAVGDLNGDGIPDLVVGSDSAAGLTVAIGNGAGGFTATTLPGGICPMYPVLADFNGDGNLDIVVGNQCNNGILVYLGNGDGTFQSPLVISGSSRINTLVVADFNGDGNLDIAAANANGGTVDVYLGVGDGTFSAVTHYPATMLAASIAAADFDGDGKIDLVVASGFGSSGLVILRGNGDGTFRPAAVISNASGLSSVAAIGDLNLDGNLDIVGIDQNTTLQAWLGNGDGTFQPTPQFIAGGNNGAGLLLGNFVNGGELNVAAGFSSSVDLYLPTLTISPSSANFGTVDLNSAAQQIFTLTNLTPNTVTFGSASIIEPNLTDYSQTNTCTEPIAPTASCTLTVTFSPHAVGPQNGTLIVIDSAPGSPQFAGLIGNGVAAPLASVSTPALFFGNENLGVPSVAQAVNVTNTGTAPLTGLGANILGTNAADFAQTNNCPNPLAIASACSFTVTFTPSDLGPRSATLQISDNAPDNPQIVALSGRGILLPSQLAFMPGPPATIAAGNSIGIVNVAVETSRSTVVSSSTADIQVTIAGPNSFSSSQTRTAVSGAATFNFSSTLLNVAGPYTITAVSPNLSPAVAALTVTPQASASQLTVTGFPSSTFSNVPHSLTVTVSDVFGNPVSGYAGTITLSSSDSAAILTPSPYSFVPADMGAHTFSGTLVTLGAQSISATDQNLSGTEEGIEVSAPPQFVVNTLADDAGTSACGGSGTCSLRSAINQANLQGAGNISVDTSQLGGSGPYTATLTEGVLELSTVINLAGPGAAQFLVSGGGTSGVFEVDAGANATISGLTATLGMSADSGGAITNDGTLTLSNVSVSNSTAASNGGGIYNAGALTVNSSEISANSAVGNGGAIDNSGTLIVVQSTISGDTAADGAAIENEAGGLLTLMQSTASANTATGDNGGTVSNQNEANGAATILESIVAGNVAPGGDCVNCGAQSPFNLFDASASALQLGSLAGNGGTTQTMVPQPGSVAIGAGSVELVENSGIPQSLANDQRGAGFPRVVNNSVDLGAVQSNSGPAVSIALLTAASSTAGQPLSLTVNAFAAGGNPAATFADTVHFSSSDPQAVLPGDYAFVPADVGSHLFTLTLRTSGSQTVTVTDVENVSLASSQSVADAPAAAAAIAATAGSGQSADVNSAFSTPLEATISDAFGNGVPQIAVTFTAPASGPSGAFSGGAQTVTVATGGNGVATAPPLTANSSVGQFTVTAGAGGLGLVQFALTNAAAAPPGYTVSATPAELTIVQGQSGSTTFTFTPAGGFAGTINLSCSGLPAYAQCTFVPAQAVMAGNNAVVDVTLTVNTGGAEEQVSDLRPDTFRGYTRGILDAQFMAAFAVVMFVLILESSDPRKKRLHRARLRFALLLATMGGTGLMACGGEVSPSTSAHSSMTPPGKYTLTVKAGTQSIPLLVNVVQQ
jgi:CSLREA domain-containing protein